jgi:hypothetical protein
MINSAEFDVDALDDMSLNIIVTFFEREGDSMSIHDYCNDWRLTGALIEKYHIGLSYHVPTDAQSLEAEASFKRYDPNHKAANWMADIRVDGDIILQSASSPSIAVARTIVMLVTKLGKTFQIPEHLAQRIPGFTSK